MMCAVCYTVAAAKRAKDSRGIYRETHYLAFCGWLMPVSAVCAGYRWRLLCRSWASRAAKVLYRHYACYNERAALAVPHSCGVVHAWCYFLGDLWRDVMEFGLWVQDDEGDGWIRSVWRCGALKIYIHEYHSWLYLVRVFLYTFTEKNLVVTG